MKRFEYAITVEEKQTIWTMWHQDQHGNGKTLTKPMVSFCDAFGTSSQKLASMTKAKRPGSPRTELTGPS